MDGESRYSKGQKDAGRNLILYIITEENIYWEAFLSEIKVPLGDSLARVALSKSNPDYETARSGFLDGKNHPDDIPNMIWLFSSFKNVGFMAKAIEIWKSGDQVVGRKIDFGWEVRAKVLENAWDADEKQAAIREINQLSQELTVLERQFSESLGCAARTISTSMLFVNIFLTVILIGIASLLAGRLIRNLRKSNLALVNANNELDQFVYSVSHDIRAPLTSLRGLIDITRSEKNSPKVKTYLDLMKKQIDHQDAYIREVIDYFRNIRVNSETEAVNLPDLFNFCLNQYSYMEGFNQIKFEVNFTKESVLIDPIRIRIIFNNLISNAIKYFDSKKSDPYLRVEFFDKDQFYFLTFEDNGIGILKENLGKIFDMFFQSKETKKGSGLGLYLTRQCVYKLKGTIKAESEYGKGTTFTIKLPIN